MNDNLNLSNLSRPEAFQTGISNLVRKTVHKQIKSIQEPVLDACCGNGIFLLELCARFEKYSDVFGFDLDADALKTAEQLFIDNNLPVPQLSVQDATNLPYENEKFQSIFCLNTLINIHPFEIIEKIITELFRALKPRGKIYIDFRNKNNPVLNYKYKKNIKLGSLTTYAHKKSDFDNIISKLDKKNYSFKTIGNPIPFLAKGYLLIIEKQL